MQQDNLPLFPTLERRDNFFPLEEELRCQGFCHIAGIDEAGRGALAGPVVAAAVILPPNTVIEGLDDSKNIPPKKREELYKIIQTVAQTVAIGVTSAQYVDTNNVRIAALKAMSKALRRLNTSTDIALIDGRDKIPTNFITNEKLQQNAIIGGDSKIASIAAASIIAKVYRDQLLVYADRKYPKYNFAKHKGYATKIHKQAINKYGICPFHRKSYAPCAKATQDNTLSY